MREEKSEEAAKRAGWGRVNTKNKESVEVGGYVCPICLGIVQDVNMSARRRVAIKAGTGGASVTVPGKMVGKDVICLYVLPENKEQ